MSILSSLFSSGAADLVKGVGGVIDNLHTSKEEKLEAEQKIKELESIFPQMILLDSNHSSLVYRRSKKYGIPKAYIRDYNDFLGVSNKWKWLDNLTITLPNKQRCLFTHGISAPTGGIYP